MMGWRTNAVLAAWAVIWAGVLPACGGSAAPEESAPPTDDELAASGGEGPSEGTRSEPCDDCATRARALYDGGDPVAALPLFERACAADDAEGCGGLMEIYGHGDGVEADFPRSVQYGTRACELGAGRACLLVGNTLRSGSVIAQDLATATTLFERGCTLGDAECCEGLGVVLFPNRADPAIRQRTVTAFRAACELGREEGCRDAAVVLATGGSAADVVEARASVDASCARGYAGSCAVLGMLLRDGEGGPADVPRAVTLFERACASDIGQACLNLGAAIVDGQAGERDLARALTLLRRGCELGEQIACRDVPVVEREIAQASAAGSSGPAAGSSGPAAREPRYSTTIETMGVNGANFRDVRATCGMFEVMAILGALAPRAQRCGAGRARFTVEGGTPAGESLSGAGACLVRAARGARVGSLTCTLEVSVGG